MVKREIDWKDNAELPDHSRRKHKILADYVFEYVRVRATPLRRGLKLAIVDGFSGAGRYKCGSPGSPLIFIEQLRLAIDTINIERGQQNLPAFTIDCLLLLNDRKRAVVEQLKTFVEPIRAEIRETGPHLTLNVQYFSRDFKQLYPEVRQILQARGVTNVLFNLDQYGHSQILFSTLADIMSSFERPEIFYTFMIKPLVAFLQQSDPARFRQQMAYLDLTEGELSKLDGLMGKSEFLAVAERIVYGHFGGLAPFVSPFSIHSPGGWKYWLIHFTTQPRGRQVYNNILHRNATYQAHAGRAGIFSLGYDERLSDTRLHLFGPNDQVRSLDELREDIPQFLRLIGEQVPVEEFDARVFNRTPARVDDIRQAVIDSQEISVVTPDGGTRRKAHTIDRKDLLILSPQRSFFSVKGLLKP